MAAPPERGGALRTAMNEPPSDPGGRQRRGSLLRAIRSWLRSVGRRNGETWREAIEELIEENEETAATLRPDERTLLANLLDFGNLKVEDVMRPRADIVAVGAEVSLDEMLAWIRERGHSRMPVYRETLDDVIGLVHIRDVMAQMGGPKPFRLTEIVRPILFVPPSMRVIDLLTKMRDTRIHMAVVVDEYGGTDGLVTIEDIVEEIVGEIEDEHEAEHPSAIVEAPDGTLIADARTPIGELEAKLGSAIGRLDRADDADSLGGLVFSLAGRVPGRGELIVHPDGLEFEILEADPRRIKRLRVRRTAAKQKTGA